MDTAAFTKWVNNNGKSVDALDINGNDKGISDREIPAGEKIKLTPFPFDPNNLPEEKWREIGLAPAQIAVIKNYETKGGRFYSPDDLAKIYSISEEEYGILKPFIKIKTVTKEKEKSKIDLHPFPFDPNFTTKEDFTTIGLNTTLIKTILNYRDKGGAFREKEDFAKIYGLSEEAYLILEPYIEIKKDTLSIVSVSHEIIPLEININTADTLDLQQLPGIGPSYSRKIVKYRELLGGYYQKEQLLEVYGMDSTRFNTIRSHIIINEGELFRININTATIKELIKHPYIEFYLAKSIIIYRQENGQFENTGQLLQANIAYEELYRKIKPYLKISD